MRSASRVMDGMFRSLGVSSPLDTESLEMAEHYWYCSAEKAKEELGFKTRDPQLTVLDTVRDIQSRHNLLPKPATVSRMETT